MARIRYLKPDFFLDAELADHEPHVRLLFAGLWCLADREGRLEDDARRIKAQLFPYESVDVESMLCRLETHWIIRYNVNGRKFIQIINFSKHQKPHHTEKDSEIPEPIGDLTVIKPLSNRSLTPSKGMGKGMEKGRLIEAFATFWEAYPRKTAKKNAVRAWEKIAPQNGLVETIMAKLAEMKTSEQWTRDSGKYIPYPATWLNGERWHDETPQTTPPDAIPEYLRNELPAKEAKP